MRPFPLLPASLAACLLGPSLAAAQVGAPAVQPACHPYKEIARQLGSRYAEAPVSLGLQSNGNLLQVFASAASGSWTIVSTAPDGLACILAAGESWESLRPKAIASAT